MARREQMHIVIVGHVDHGKSTVIGRLLADTGSLPEGKLDQVKAMCERNARPFEYAFLLDALKNEQAQGITIDTARCFFKTAARDYILNDAPGHIEFLKNMVTGAARAEAALLVIDAHEGIQENSKRHGYMVSMLGIRQVAVLVNKMDLAGYSHLVFEAIRQEYTAFLARLGVEPIAFIPISAREGVNMIGTSSETPWYTGPSVLEQVDAFTPSANRRGMPFRMPVQDIYKFTEEGDERRIIAGTIESGEANVGDEVMFLPSGKRSVIESIEAFNANPGPTISASQAVGVTLSTQIYIKPGELMARSADVQPRVAGRFRANLFWMGRSPMIPKKRYKLKIGAARVPVELAEVLQVLDASELSSVQDKVQIDRHDVAECVLETTRPIAFDLRNELEQTARFVIVDNYEIAACGIVLAPADESRSILKEEIRRREFAWEKGYVNPADRSTRSGHKGKFIVFTGSADANKLEIARQVEKQLFCKGCSTYYLGIRNVFEGLDEDERTRSMSRDEHIQRLGEMARVLTDTGLLFITTIAGIDDFDLDRLKLLNEPNELFVVNVGENVFSRFRVDVELPEQPSLGEAVEKIVNELNAQKVLIDYYI